MVASSDAKMQKPEQLVPPKPQQQFSKCLCHGITTAAQASKNKTEQNKISLCGMVQLQWHPPINKMHWEERSAHCYSSSASKQEQNIKQQSTCLAWHPSSDAKTFNCTEKATHCASDMATINAAAQAI